MQQTNNSRSNHGEARMALRVHGTIEDPDTNAAAAWSRRTPAISTTRASRPAPSQTQRAQARSTGWGGDDDGTKCRKTKKTGSGARRRAGATEGHGDGYRDAAGSGSRGGKETLRQRSKGPRGAGGRRCRTAATARRRSCNGMECRKGHAFTVFT